MNINPHVLFNKLEKIVFILLNNDSKKLQNLLYCVYVSENDYNKIQDDNIKIRSQKISILIPKKRI